jgi:RNA polymerase sigma-70 factor (ECF subfamily)
MILIWLILPSVTVTNSAAGASWTGNGIGVVHQQRAPAGHEPAPLPGSPQERDLARRFAQAFTEDDIDGVVALLTDDAWLAMPPAPHEYLGAAAVATFLRASATWRGRRHFRLVPCRANTQPAFGCYLACADQPAAYAVGLLVLTLSGNQIRGITRFLDDELPRVFGLPDALD